MVYWEGYLYLVVWALNRLQSFLDFWLNLVSGYKTKTGSRSDRNRATREYDKAAQMVSNYLNITLRVHLDYVISEPHDNLITF